ncbi:hypothetical protein HNV11_03955 [Spirosoma taeanense]|uniref:Uncharacterized protein n=1 Tax=Spirosoma taeanense TaxID=2735870 RepID=A0A6M5Y1J9_9BACT|nr:hypothetical protein [Spirosoma taeanense]QJW88588.1 hypothetical protein HNV11_03955 [Spirosoma taeanense]
MKITTLRLVTGLMMATLFAACSRPVAYFQPGQREHIAATPAPVNTTETLTPATVEAPVVTAATTTEPVVQANAALEQATALVRNDAKLSADKTVAKRLNRVRTLLASASAKGTLTPSATNAPRKAGLMERMMLKKVNKKINRQLAPANPEKAMASTGTLATGAVLVIVGLLLLLLTSGTGATIGLILLLVGAVVLLIGLL